MVARNLFVVLTGIFPHQKLKNVFFVHILCCMLYITDTASSCVHYVKHLPALLHAHDVKSILRNKSKSLKPCSLSARPYLGSAII